MPTKDLFPSVAELVLQEILVKNDVIKNNLLREFGVNSCKVEIYRQVELKFPATPELPEIKFDDQAKIGLALSINSSQLIPIEVKTGVKELEAFKIRRYNPCGWDKANRAATGKMLAVLDRKFSTEFSNAVDSRQLCGIVDGRAIPLADQWGIIARQAVIKGWKSTQPNKNFLAKAKFFAIEEICTSFGEAEFNKIVRDLFCHDHYFTDWKLQD